MSGIKTYAITEPYLDLECGLGEGPYWESSTNTLRFVDIVKKHLHTINLSEGPGSHQQYQLDYSIGCTADIEGTEGKFVFGGKSGYGVFDRASGEHRIVRPMWSDEEREDDGGGKTGIGGCKEERMRANDGAVDAKGRFFAGTMNDPALIGENFTDEGVLFRLDPDLSLHRVKEGVTIPNGTSWSADNKTMYFTDSPTGKIMAYPYDIETGEAKFSEGETFFTTPYPGTVPDGHCQDVEGHFWVALFGSSKVVRVDPSGQVVAEVELPTRCVTCPVLCGTELFITTAGELDPDKYPSSVRYQGRLFKVEVGVKGKPLNKFKATGKL